MCKHASSLLLLTCHCKNSNQMSKIAAAVFFLVLPHCFIFPVFKCQLGIQRQARVFLSSSFPDIVSKLLQRELPSEPTRWAEPGGGPPSAGRGGARLPSHWSSQAGWHDQQVWTPKNADPSLRSCSAEYLANWPLLHSCNVNWSRPLQNKCFFPLMTGCPAPPAATTPGQRRHSAESEGANLSPHCPAGLVGLFQFCQRENSKSSWKLR